MYVTDTHSFLWYLQNDDNLSGKARDIFESCDSENETIIIPSIVLIESIFILNAPETAAFRRHKNERSSFCAEGPFESFLHVLEAHSGSHLLSKPAPLGAGIKEDVICEKKNIELKFHQILDKLKAASNYYIYPLGEEVAIECSKIRLKEPHDRIIAASANILNAKLITRDNEIKKSGYVETVW